MTGPSGTFNFNLSNSDVVTEAFERCGVRLPQLTSQHMMSARRSLNLEMQRWSNLHLNLWKVALTTVPLVTGQSVYPVNANVIMILDMYYSFPSGVPGQTIDRILEPVSRTDYASYSNKLQPGTPTVFWFDRLNVPSITLWQPPSVGSPNSISYYYFTQIEDANLGSGEIPDINYRFQDALCAGLAARLAEKYAPALEAGLRQKAQAAMEEATAEDRERVAMHIRPVLRSYWTP